MFVGFQIFQVFQCKKYCFHILVEIHIGKGCLILERFSLWLKFPKKGAKNHPEDYPSKEKMLKIVI